MQRIACFNGSFIEEEKANLHVSDLAIQRGYGVFDFFRTVNNVPLFIDDYLERFYNSASGLHLNFTLDQDELKNIIDELIARNNIPSSGIRLMLTGGYSEDSYSHLSPNLVISQQSLQMPGNKIFEEGMRLITHEYVRELPAIKSIHYIMGIWLQQKIRAANANDVLYFFNNKVSELPRSNFFLVTKDNVVITPHQNILPGITRKKVMQLASAQFQMAEQTITLQDIREAKEAFVTSTTKRLQPVVQVDDIIIGNGAAGEVTKRLYELFIEMEHAFIKAHTNH
ncbi:MAG: amino acid aminotransferase [Chitinophagaceae bacterium]|nr:amino acid aminotransferase [Chitinophagaceae bacterium]